MVNRESEQENTYRWLINGKYIGIRFIIHETNSKVSLSNIECYVNKYRE